MHLSSTFFTALLCTLCMPIIASAPQQPDALAQAQQNFAAYEQAMKEAMRNNRWLAMITNNESGISVADPANIRTPNPALENYLAQIAQTGDVVKADMLALSIYIRYQRARSHLFEVENQVLHAELKGRELLEQLQKPALLTGKVKDSHFE